MFSLRFILTDTFWKAKKVKGLFTVFNNLNLNNSRWYTETLHFSIRSQHLRMKPAPLTVNHLAQSSIKVWAYTVNEHVEQALFTIWPLLLSFLWSQCVESFFHTYPHTPISAKHTAAEQRASNQPSNWYLQLIPFIWLYSCPACQMNTLHLFIWQTYK